MVGSFRFWLLRASARVWRVIGAVVVCVLAWAWYLPSAAGATVIKVDTTSESALFNTGPGGAGELPPPNGPHPAYDSRIVGLHHTDKCSLREAVEAANTHDAVGACPAGTGNDTIELMPGTYPVWDNFFLLEKMTFRGPNAGLAGNDPKRGPEAILSFDYNPQYAAQVSMFWLGKGSGGQTEGKGSVFNGLVLQGGFVPDCSGGLACEIVGIVQPSQGVVEQGYTLTDSILRKFSFGVYLGGTDTITRNVFERMDQNPNSPANGHGIYSDFVYVSQGSIIEDNVFNDPRLSGVLIQGDSNRGTVDNAVIADNVFLKKANDELGAFVINSTGDVIKNNVFLHRNPKPFADRRDAAILLDKDTNLQITGNTIVGWQRGISIGPVGNPGPPGSTGVTVAFNRIWNNTYGFRVTPSTFDTNEYALAVDANDNWWGSNGGPGSTGARPGAINPVNGVQFFQSDGTTPVPNPGGITVDRWLHLTCTVPSTVQVNVPAPVVGQVKGMPTVDVFDTLPPWFIAEHQPLMAASAPGVGNVFGFDRVPNQGPNNAELTGTLVATNTGSGDVLVDLDSERVACPLTATPGPNEVIDKVPDSRTVTAGGRAGFRITVTDRSRVTARNLWICDRLPRQMKLVAATRQLHRLGRLRCAVIPTLRPHHHASFHVTLRVASTAPAGTETNVAEVVPGVPGAPAGQPPPVVRPTDRVAAAVKVRRRRAAPAPPLPRVTG